MNSLETEFVTLMESKNLEKMKDLLKLGFPVNRHLRREGSPLGSHTYPLLIAIELDLSGIVPLMLTNGASPNCFDSTGTTPAMAACAIGNLPILKLLLTYKADISARDFFGNTMLHVAGINAQLDIIKFCINDLKLPAIVKNRRGQTPLTACVEVQELARSLLDIEKMQETIEYLWKVEDEFKKHRIKETVSKNSYIKKHPRFNMSNLAPISLLAEERKLTVPGNLGKSNIQNYLKAKHIAICQNVSFSQNYKSLRFSPVTTPGIRSASVKPLTN